MRAKGTDNEFQCREEWKTNEYMMLNYLFKSFLNDTLFMINNVSTKYTVIATIN
ncbi:hypothetical protein QJS10_CPB11g01411 [Acorus calamus]|uniref:Uncharacterized protein n=1 Tax=Acorus calamus TaxID=4465 RepID=A0AAV9DSW9_ACOCL|nr:hypothetical protein QJS10_CPB11g01411 [Acorus calamus]